MIEQVLLEQGRRVRDWTSAMAQRTINFRAHYSFVDRQTGAARMLMVIAGYKDHLWPYTLARIERFNPEKTDVCLLSAGLHSTELDTIARQAGWSYLSLRERNLSLAQNVAITLHPRAEWIHRLDEDIFIGEGYFEALFRGYQQISTDRVYRMGVCAPVINVNGFSYINFLRTLGLEGEYFERFGELTRAGDGIRAWGDGEAARWLWEQTVPFDEVAGRFAAEPFGYSPVPHRFSIGAILFTRELWELLGGLKAKFPARLRVGLGDDEVTLCSAAVTHSRVTCVVHNVLAGHFAFWPQDAAMRRALRELSAGLVAPPPAAQAAPEAIGGH